MLKETQLIDPITMKEEFDSSTVYGKTINYLIDTTKKVDAIVLPIKVGQIVYMKKEPWFADTIIAPFQVTNISITQNKKGNWTKKFRSAWLLDGRATTLYHDMSFEDIGKTVFFSKEDAERLLK